MKTSLISKDSGRGATRQSGKERRFKNHCIIDHSVNLYHSATWPSFLLPSACDLIASLSSYRFFISGLVLFYSGHQLLSTSPLIIRNLLYGIKPAMRPLATAIACTSSTGVLCFSTQLIYSRTSISVIYPPVATSEEVKDSRLVICMRVSRLLYELCVAHSRTSLQYIFVTFHVGIVHLQIITVRNCLSRNYHIRYVPGPLTKIARPSGGRYTHKVCETGSFPSVYRAHLLTSASNWG